MVREVSARAVQVDEIDALAHGPSVPDRVAALTLTVRVTNADQLQRDVALLAQASERSLEVRDRLVHLGGLLPELVRADLDDTAAFPAGELGIRLQLAEPLAELCAAVRAGQFDA